MKDVETILASNIELSLVKRLLEYYQKLKQNFSFGKYEECEVNSAKFAETAFRILQYLTKQQYTPLDEDIRINDLIKYLEDLPKNRHAVSIRILIPRVLWTVYTIRSKRGVIHTSEIDPNLMDATFLVSACDWVLAELIRLFGTENPNEAQKIITIIVERTIPIIEEFDGDLKVLNPKLSVADKILLILYQKCPDYVATGDLKKWIKTKSSSHISTVLRQLEDDAKIYRRDKENKITRKGILYIEKKLPSYLHSY